MINEFTDYNLEPTVAWAKTYTEDSDHGIWSIEYGINVLGNLDTEVYEFRFWGRATLKPYNRYMPIFVQQRYSLDARSLFTGLYSDMRCAIQS